jgi:hypothetical protein
MLGGPFLKKRCKQHSHQSAKKEDYRCEGDEYVEQVRTEGEAIDNAQHWNNHCSS